MNNTKTKIFILYFLLLSSIYSYSQFYETGQAPANIQWEEIRTEHFRIIFPQNFYSESNKFANIAEHSYPSLSEGYSKTIKKIPVIFFNTVIESNGYVAWAPKRMELFSTPPQNTYSQPWIEQLALHETRHVNQLYNLNTGFTKLLSLIIGQIGTASAAAYIPLWFFEGDAVYNETRFSSSGRGRQPSFAMELRAIHLEKQKKYSYDKAYLGSYKNYIPDHYQLGYQLVSYLKTNSDSHTIEKLPSFTGKHSFLQIPFYMGLYSYSGTSKTKLYKNTFDTLTTLWNNNLNTIILTDYLRISNKPKHYTNYNTPQYLTNESLIAKKTGIDQITQFVQLNKKGDEKIIYTPGFVNSEILSAKNEVIAWTEVIPDLRWPKRNFSVIKLYDLKVKKVKTLGKKTRYFSPALSDLAEKITCVEVDLQNRNYLAILDTKTGNVLNKVTPPDKSSQIIMPIWYDNNKIATILLNNEGKSICLYDIHAKQWETILHSTFNDISHLVRWGNHILYRSSSSGIDNIHAVNIFTKEEYQITSARFGAFEPSVFYNNLVYSNYSSDGYYISEILIDTTKWIPVKKNKPTELLWEKSLSEYPEKNIQQSNIEIYNYESKRYNKFENLIQIHSWVPFYTDNYSGDFDPKIIKPGFILFSQNNLSTFISSFSYIYDKGNHIIQPSITIKEWYPVIDIMYRRGGNPVIDTLSTDPNPPENIMNRESASIRAYLPLDLTRNKFSRGIIPSVQYLYDNVYYYNNIYKQGFSTFIYYLRVYNLLKRSQRDIHSKWGQVLELYYKHLLQNSQYGSIHAFSLTTYYPGILNHHSIKLKYGYQFQSPQKFHYRTTFINTPRGYNNFFTNEIQSFSADYSLPLLYPDLSLGPVLYLKRIRVSVFFDYSQIIAPFTNNSLVELNLKSYGAELYGDMHFLHFFAMFSPGIRYTYLPKINDYKLEFFITIDPYLF